jgi:hypothetical protein
MRVGLLDVDGHNFPNLALMKLSAYHKSICDDVEFVNFLQPYDRVYKSKVFTFTTDEHTHIMCDDIRKGGSGYNYSDKLPDEIECLCPDYDLYKTEHAYGFITRGCIRQCSWCLVPKKEGWIKKVASIEQFIGNKKSAILMDNNILSIEKGIRELENIANMGIKIDCNQGLDARLIDDSVAKILAKTKWIRFIRMSCDTIGMIDPVLNAVELIRKHSGKVGQFFVYVLCKDVETAHQRVRVLWDQKIESFVQPFIDFEKGFKVDDDLKTFARWANHKAIFKTVKWEDYKANTTKKGSQHEPRIPSRRWKHTRLRS